MLDIRLTLEEIETLKKADEIIHNFQHKLGDQLNMQAIETGEVISTEEFARVRGILNGLSSNQYWVLSFKK